MRMQIRWGITSIALMIKRITRMAFEVRMRIRVLSLCWTLQLAPGQAIAKYCSKADHDLTKIRLDSGKTKGTLELRAASLEDHEL
jgi:hypothetical protein